MNSHVVFYYGFKELSKDGIVFISSPILLNSVRSLFHLESLYEVFCNYLMKIEEVDVSQ